jgi:hypothetical protein
MVPWVRGGERFQPVVYDKEAHRSGISSGGDKMMGEFMIPMKPSVFARRSHFCSGHWVIEEQPAKLHTRAAVVFALDSLSFTFKTQLPVTGKSLWHVGQILRQERQHIDHGLRSELLKRLLDLLVIEGVGHYLSAQCFQLLCATLRSSHCGHLSALLDQLFDNRDTGCSACACGKNLYACS